MYGVTLLEILGLLGEFKILLQFVANSLSLTFIASSEILLGGAWS